MTIGTPIGTLFWKLSVLWFFGLLLFNLNTSFWKPSVLSFSLGYFHHWKSSPIWMLLYEKLCGDCLWATSATGKVAQFLRARWHSSAHYGTSFLFILFLFLGIPCCFNISWGVISSISPGMSIFVIVSSVNSWTSPHFITHIIFCFISLSLFRSPTKHFALLPNNNVTRHLSDLISSLIYYSPHWACLWAPCL